MFLRILGCSFVLLPVSQVHAANLPQRTGSELDNLPALFSTDDYPDEAIKGEEQGTVAADLEIAPTGKVVRCTITQSASPTLDARTCAVIQERASYPPSRDKHDRLRATGDKVRIRWVLPDEPDTQFADAWFEVTALVPATGANQCTVRASLPLPVAGQSACDELIRSGAPHRPQSISRPFLMTIREEHLVGEGIAPLLKGGEVARVIVRQHIDADGYVTSCSLVPEPSADVDDTPAFNCRMNAKFAPLPDNELNRGDRIMTFTWMRSFAAAPAAGK